VTNFKAKGNVFLEKWRTAISLHLIDIRLLVPIERFAQGLLVPHENFCHRSREARWIDLIVAKKLYEKGRWVCWKAFTAAPLNVLLLRFQAYPRGHLR
jgi:hypothetical protein